MSIPKELKIAPFFGGFVLETLTVGMYGESRNAIREYIQNGFDSIQKAKKLGLLSENQGLIEILMPADRNSLTFKDNGAGLPALSAAETLTRVGASAKTHDDSAGFRGIGRLAGIGFCNKLTFTTKAKGENLTTVVIFHGNKMRELMSPAKAGEISAENLLIASVEASVSETTDIENHFFQVKLEGFVDAPEEFTNPALMKDFISQVSPIGYHNDFPYKKELEDISIKCGLPIEEINLTLQDGSSDAIPIYKNYAKLYRVGEGDIKLEKVATYISEDKNWWAWVGLKTDTGAYADVRISGIRVRMKNIQIDGVDLIRDIFKQKGKSFIRFQEWSMGEVFVKPGYLIPNARRDGFEETPTWKKMRDQLAETIVSDIKTESYLISSATQTSLPVLQKKLEDLKGELNVSRRNNYQNVDKLLKISVDATSITKLAAKASKNADLVTMADLQAMSAELMDIKTEAIGKIGVTSAQNKDELEQAARDELLKDLLVLFEEGLHPTCFISVRNLIREQFGLD